MTNEAEARIVEAIMSPGQAGHRVEEIRNLVRDAFAHFKERAEMRTGELEAQLELAHVRDGQRKEQLKIAEHELVSALEVVSDLEQRERDLEERARIAEEAFAKLTERHVALKERVEANEAATRGCAIAPKSEAGQWHAKIENEAGELKDSRGMEPRLSQIYETMATIVPFSAEAPFALCYFMACLNNGIEADTLVERMSRA